MAHRLLAQGVRADQWLQRGDRFGNTAARERSRREFLLRVDAQLVEPGRVDVCERLGGKVH